MKQAGVLLGLSMIILIVRSANELGVAPVSVHTLSSSSVATIQIPSANEKSPKWEQLFRNASATAGAKPVLGPGGKSFEHPSFQRPHRDIQKGSSLSGVVGTSKGLRNHTHNHVSNEAHNWTRNGTRNEGRKWNPNGNLNQNKSKNLNGKLNGNLNDSQSDTYPRHRHSQHPNLNESSANGTNEVLNRTRNHTQNWTKKGANSWTRNRTHGKTQNQTQNDTQNNNQHRRPQKINGAVNRAENWTRKSEPAFRLKFIPLTASAPHPGATPSPGK